MNLMILITANVTSVDTLTKSVNMMNALRSILIGLSIRIPKETINTISSMI